MARGPSATPATADPVIRAGLSVIARVSGSLAAILGAEIAKGELATARGVQAAIDGLRDELKDLTRSGGLGKLAGAWKSKLYTGPRGGSLRSAGIVVGASPGLRGFVLGETIAPRFKGWLAIPTDLAPKRGLRAARPGGGGSAPRVRPANDGLALKFVLIRKGRLAALIRPEVTEPGAVKRLRRRGRLLPRGRKMQVVYWLVKSVRMPDLIDLETPILTARAAVPDLIAREWENINDVEVDDRS